MSASPIAGPRRSLRVIGTSTESRPSSMHRLQTKTGHGLESRLRKLETDQGDDQRKVGSTNRRRFHPNRRQARSRAWPGATGHNVRYVLAFGIAGVVIAFLIAYFVYV